MKLLEAAAHVLNEAGTPLHARVLTQQMLDGRHWLSSGQTPAATVQACLAMELKENPTTPFIRTAPATFGLKARDTRHGKPIPLFEFEEDTRTNAIRFVDAARELLERQGQPMHVREITELAIKGGRIQTEGKTPWATMRVQIQREIARQAELNLPPTFALDGPIVSLASGTRMPLPPDPELESIAQKIDALSTDDFEVLVEQVFRARQGGFIVTKTRRSGDGGIDVRGTVELPDGIQLTVGIQAKHHAPDKPKPTIGRPVIQALRGSLPPRAIGYVVTSGTFSRGAKEDADRSDSIHPIRLIEGDELARLVRAAKVSFTGEGRVAVPEV